MLEPSFIRGTCESLCPEHETKLRTKEHLLHFFELKSGQKNVPGILVKSFSRSAAGNKYPRLKDLRTERALQNTIEYLLKDVVLDKRKPYNFVYDFIFDRLRAVRQEVVMQSYNGKQTIQILEPIIIFLAYSRYRLCENCRDDFEPKICDQHLQECLKRVLCCYDAVNADDCYFKETKLIQIKNQCFIESMYQIFNMGSVEALTRSFRLPQEIRRDSLFQLSLAVGMNFFQGNYYRVLSKMEQLPHILSGLAALKLNHLRRKIYLTFSYAYSSKLSCVPVNWLKKLLLYSSTRALIEDCKYFNIECNTDMKSIKFFKTDFKVDNLALKERHELFVEEKLKDIFLPDVLLLKKI